MCGKGVDLGRGGVMGSGLGVKGKEDIFPRSHPFNLAERVAKMNGNDREHSCSTFYTRRIFALLKSKQTKVKFSSKDDHLALCKIISLQLLRIGLLLFLV